MFKRGSRSKAWKGPRLPVLIASLALILVVSTLLLSFGKKSEKPDSSYILLKQKWNSFESSVQFHPTVELRNGTDVIWQIPDSPKAVLFQAHGCAGTAGVFWDRSPNCPDCIGLPEERLHVLHALARGFAVITISSMEKCWTMGEERLVVKDIIKWWVERHRLGKLPLVASGASSGGFFVSTLATVLRFNSIAIMIAEGLFDQMDIPVDYPPTLFVHMPKDLYRQRKIGEYMQVLRTKGIDVAEVECLEFPLWQNFFADRIPGLDQATSSKLFDLFRDKGFIDENRYMKNSGRKILWKEALRENNTILLDENLFRHVEEELNLAFAYHEMTSLQSEQIFKWFETHMN